MKQAAAFWAREMKTLSVILAVLILCGSGFAEESGQASWKGIVKNASGAPVPSAKVTLKGKDKSAEATTAADGRFQFSSLQAGEYHLTIESKSTKADYAQPVALANGAKAVVVTV